ncbi:MAG TPA: GNAT family N-acetyltransferase [Bacteroidia bacterium]
MSHSIRAANTSDVEIIAELGRSTFLDAHSSSAPKEDMENYLTEKFSKDVVKNDLDNPTNIFHLLFFSDKPAGYSKIQLNTPCTFLPENDAVCKMERLYISKDFYDKKLGYKLFVFNKELCLQNNQTGLWLTVWVENERAVAFYERLGFRIIGEILFKVGATQNPNYVMWLEF